MNTKHLIALSLLACGLSAQAQIEIAPIAGSISITKPGVYGRIDFGQAPPPPVQLVYPQPVIIEQAPVAVHQRPIYLYVPPGHQKDWKHYCHRYNACGQPVYFVQERYVRDRYDTYQRERYEHERHYDHDHDHDHDHGHDRDHDHDDHGRGHDDHDHGRGHDHD